MRNNLVTYLLTAIVTSMSIPSNIYSQTQFEEVTSQAGVVMSFTSRWSTGLAWGDYNNDGLLDVYVTSWGQASTGQARNALYRNLGFGLFVNVAAAEGVDLGDNSTAAVWGDMDNDGDLDLFVANFSEGDVIFKNLLIETGSASFVDVTVTSNFINESVGRSKAAVWGDYNNDGFLDIYVSKFWGKNALYRNNGGSTFSLVDGVVSDVRDSEWANWVDYDDDGDLDLYVVNREQENRLYINNNGEFSVDPGLLNDTQFGRFSVWSDFDNNGKLDLFVGNIGANSLYQQISSGDFLEVSGATGVKTAPNAWDTWGGTWGDYDGDGDLDLVFVGGFDEVAPSSNFTGTFGNILFNNNGVSFTDVTTAAGLIRGALNFSTAEEVGSFASAAAFADYDNDGDLDLMITNTHQNLMYENKNPTNNFLKVWVQGRGVGFNNRNGIGSKVRIYNTNAPGVVVAMREIRSGPEPMYAHFGLSLSETYNIEISFLNNGSIPADKVTISGVSVPLDTVIIQK